MKEYIAGTGGRYTYVDDFLNLQDLSLSMSSIFEGCSNFIISGCEVSGLDLSSGYVWLNGKVRYFEGVKGVGFPYFIYEHNVYETTTYANDINKRGRCNFLCKGAGVVPDVDDPVTLAKASFIEIGDRYAPRFIDKFMGRYALLLDSPFASQTIRKDIKLEGQLFVEKGIESKGVISVVHATNGFALKNQVKTSGCSSFGVYQNNLLISEIEVGTDGYFTFKTHDQELARINNKGFQSSSISSNRSQIGSIVIQDSLICNYLDNTDTGAININSIGYNGGNTRYRDFNVYDGKSGAKPLLQVVGRTATIHLNSDFNINSTGTGISIRNTQYTKSDANLINSIFWKDSKNEQIASIGFATNNSFDFNCTNLLGNIILAPKGFTNVLSELRIKGTNIDDIFVSITTFNTELNKKVTAIDGKQLSTEDFTNALKKKLEGISTSTVSSAGIGYVTASDVLSHLNKKVTAGSNLSDLSDKAESRENLGVLSINESNQKYLHVTGCLKELVSLTAEEINGLTPEEASALKATKQAEVRDVLDAEKKGIGALKLSKSANLSDIPDTIQARRNISVYSIAEMDKLLAGKLSNDAAYSGVPFLSEHKQKLESIKTGNFAGVDNEGQAIAQVEGYALITHIVKEFKKKANLLLDGYTEIQKKEIASNIAVYSQQGADGKFVSIGNLFQDYIDHLIKDGKSTVQAQQILRDKLGVPSVDELKNNYLRKDGKLTDLQLTQADKKTVCTHLGAAYAEEYQTKLIDTGWLQMTNSGSGTDTRRLFIRQIGKIVCIQGIINTGKRDGSNWGGVVAKIPNQIEPPKHGLRTSFADYNDDHNRNRGASFKIVANSRDITLYESGWYNIDTEINFTYMI